MKKIITSLSFLLLFSCVVFGQQEKKKPNPQIFSAGSANVQQNIAKPQIEPVRENLFRGAGIKPVQNQKPSSSPGLVKSYKSATDADKATVILRVTGDLWGDGTGYQMLLDADHNTYNSVFRPGSPLSVYVDADPAIYAQFEYKIPANADGKLSTTNIIVNAEGSVVIPEGVYDFCIANPTPGGTDGFPAVWVASGDYGGYGKFVFRKGYTYVFEVTRPQGTSDFVSLRADNEAKMIGLSLPKFSSKLTNAEDVKIKVKNAGEQAMAGFGLSYRINNGTVVTENYTGNVLPGDTLEYLFTQKGDLSAAGEYFVKSWVTLPGDMNIANDTLSGSTMKYGTIGVPYAVDFTSSASLDWNSTVDNAWVWSDYDQAMLPNAASVPLVSRPITIPAGEYRFSLNYKSGLYFPQFGIENPESFSILIGKEGTDPQTWTPVKVYTDDITYGLFITGETKFTIDADGEYSFAIMPTVALGGLRYKSISISKILDHDLRVNSLGSATLPRLTPVYQVNADHSFLVGMVNRGRNQEPASQVNIKVGGSVIASGETFTLPVDAMAQITLTGKVKGLKVNDELRCVAEINLPSDEYVADNQLEYAIQVSDSTYACDKAVNFADGVGANEGGIQFGNVFTLAKTDTLTSVSVGLANVSQTSSFGIALYEVNDFDYSLGMNLFTVTSYERGLGGQIATFAVPEAVLDAGTYYFEVQQTESGKNVALAYDSDPFGVFYMKNEEGGLSAYSGFGYLCIRPNFGKNYKTGLGIGRIDVDKNVNVYYSPASKTIEVKSSDTPINKVSVFSVDGRKVFESVSGLSLNDYSVNVAAVYNGVYVVLVETAAGKVTSKVVVR
ncbi:MAG: DUF2436 domain-containing protein [Dysgonomonas sp.]